MTKHTPGPWFHINLGPEVTDGNSHEVLVSCSLPDIISVCTMDNALTATLAEKEDNARLIAAAPSLLKACQIAIECFGDEDGELADAALSDIRNAIAKATGE